MQRILDPDGKFEVWLNTAQGKDRKCRDMTPVLPFDRERTITSQLSTRKCQRHEIKRICEGCTLLPDFSFVCPLYHPHLFAHNMSVGNLPLTISESILSDFFVRFGKNLFLFLL